MPSDASKLANTADDNDMLDLMHTAQGNVMARATTLLTASKNTRLDHQLPFSEFLFARNYFLTTIQNAKWGDTTVDTFNWFFHNIKNHTIREEGDRGERALLHYVHRVHLDWHDKLKQGKAYNIGTIKDELVERIARELDSKDVWSNLEQVRTLTPW
ncbi:hypothetical protein J3R83DRAFT_8613 [Lanmaoa asiatica]|nr:hypothetical protein J3R83DRAFT_8613 [Lanmaoa asiatica]